MKHPINILPLSEQGIAWTTEAIEKIKAAEELVRRAMPPRIKINMKSLRDIKGPRIPRKLKKYLKKGLKKL